MIKNYTQQEYAEKAVQANEQGQMLYVLTQKEEEQAEAHGELIIAPVNYYICYNGNYTDGTVNPNYEAELLNSLKSAKLEENTRKAKEKIENGYVEFKNAQFETNAQTVGDLTATLLLMQEGGQTSTQWLSRDDKVVELTVEDIAVLGGLIAQFKNTVWNEKYIGYKTEIENAQTPDEVKEIEIDYT